MNTFKQKLLDHKLNRLLHYAHDYIYKLPFVQSSSDYKILAQVNGNYINIEIFVKCINRHRYLAALENWKKYKWKMNFSLLYHVNTNIHIVNEDEDVKTIIKELNANQRKG